jgi:hypothetical protein
MAKFVLVYRGGEMGETPEAQQKAMEAWMNWFGDLGEAVVDGGSPFGASSSLASNGSTTGAGASGLTGYSIVSADSIADAVHKAKGCPVLASGGDVEVYESLPIG